MNTLGALVRICKTLPDEQHLLFSYKAARFSSQMLSGRSVADVGCEPVLHMRHFQVSFLDSYFLAFRCSLGLNFSS